MDWIGLSLHAGGLDSMKLINALYISYDGALEPLGQSQVIPYLEGLAREGICFTLITFEKLADLRKNEEVQQIRERLDRSGIHWIKLRYHKCPTLTATAWDVLIGSLAGLWTVFRTRAQIVHARSYVAGAMALVITAITNTRFIFDMRGFWPEERVEGNIWRANGLLYRLSKILERWLFARADEVVVLTEKAKETLTATPYRSLLRLDSHITVIPCCVDTSRFSLHNLNEGNLINALGLKPDSYLVYVGSLVAWYLLDEMLDFFSLAKNSRPSLQFLILNRGEHNLVKERAAKRELGPHDLVIVEAKPQDVPVYLTNALAGICFKKPSFSTKGSSPIKFAEFLAAGLPVVVNEEVGDADQFVYRNKVGVVVTRFTQDEYNRRWSALVDLLQSDNDLRHRCRIAVETQLSLQSGVRKYSEIYSQKEGGEVQAKRPRGRNGVFTR